MRKPEERGIRMRASRVVRRRFIGGSPNGVLSMCELFIQALGFIATRVPSDRHSWGKAREEGVSRTVRTRQRGRRSAVITQQHLTPRFKKEFCPLNIATVQRWIQDNRFDPSTPLTIQQAVHTNMVHGLSNWNGIKLVGSPTRSMPLPPLTVHLSRFSEKAGKAIIAAGGSCLSVYHNRLSLRQEVYPEKFKGREVKPAGPTRRPDIGEFALFYCCIQTQDGNDVENGEICSRPTWIAR